MLQKRKNTAWMLLAASLMVMSIFISCFATSEKQTYAKNLDVTPSPSPATLTLIRPTSSTTGAVYVINVTRATLICVSLPKQDTTVNVPGQFTTKDHVYLVRFPGSQCDITTIAGATSKFIDIKHISDLNGQPVKVSSDPKQRHPV